MAMITETEHAKRHEREAEQFRELEDAVRNVWDSAAICYLALEHAGEEYVGVPESEYIKVTKTNWRLLTFAVRQQEELADKLASKYLGEPGATA